MTAEPVRGQRRWLASFENGTDQLWVEEGETQHLTEVFLGDAIAGRDGGKIVAVAEGRPPLLCPRDIGDQDVIFGGLRGTDDQAAFDATTTLLKGRPNDRASDAMRSCAEESKSAILSLFRSLLSMPSPSRTVSMPSSTR